MYKSVLCHVFQGGILKRNQAQGLPSCLLAVLPSFRNAIIPLLMEGSSVVPIDSLPTHMSYNTMVTE